MTNAAIAEEFVRLCREGTKEEIVAFHREHQQKILEAVDVIKSRDADHNKAKKEE